MRLCWGDCELDEERFELRRDGQKVPVQPKVLDLLFYLVRARERVALRRELFESVWPSVAVGEASLARAVLEARRAIGDELQEVLVTVRGRGFRFAAAVTEKHDAAQAPVPLVEVADPSFVGRSSCMTCLEARLDEAARGKGGIVWLAGEAGIGKTRAADELARRARGRGANVYRTSAHQAPAAPQFWLWAQIVRAHAALHPGPRTVELEETIAPLLSGAAGLSSEAQFVLFDAFTRFFVAAATPSPLVIVIDDAHRADEGSQSLLQFFVREIRHAAVVVVATYRDTELHGGDERARAFAALLGECGGLSIPLRGLAPEEIPRFVEVTSGSVPSSALVQALYERTGGNPLYMQQVLQSEWADKALHDTAHQLASSMDLQQGLVESIRQHVKAVSAETRELLTLAAVLGRTFDFAELALVSGLSHDALMNRLDEGVGARVLLKAKSGGHRFSHALVHEVLRKSLASMARAALHADIASKLERHYGAGADAHAVTLAYHWIRALPQGKPEHALRFSMLAAQQASARDAHRAAARHWNDATQALTHLAADDPRHATARLGAARAHAKDGDSDAAREAFVDGAILARTLGSADELAEAAIGFAALTNPTTSARRSLLVEARDMLPTEGERAVRQREAIEAALAGLVSPVRPVLT